MNDRIELDMATYSVLVGQAVLLRDLLEEFHRNKQVSPRLQKMLKGSDKQYQRLRALLEQLADQEQRSVKIPYERQLKLNQLRQEVRQLQQLLSEYRKGAAPWWTSSKESGSDPDDHSST